MTHASYSGRQESAFPSCIEGGELTELQGCTLKWMLMQYNFRLSIFTFNDLSFPSANCNKCSVFFHLFVGPDNKNVKQYMRNKVHLLYVTTSNINLHIRVRKYVFMRSCNNKLIMLRIKAKYVWIKWSYFVSNEWS